MPPLRYVDARKCKRAVGSAWLFRDEVMKRGRDDMTTEDERPRIYSRACAAPDGICHGPFELPLAAHAEVTGVQRPGRGGGAGPARGCGARSPALASGRHELWLKVPHA
jgi:hypothetical protein